MNFAKNLLGKYGWKEGDGLGKNSDGIALPLKALYKFDKSGFGHNKADELNNHWWENAYNNASNNLDINSADGEVSLGLKGESIEVSTKAFTIVSNRSKKKSKGKYDGVFLKTATLDSSGEKRNSETVEMVKPIQFNTVSDEDLFKACKGRTAHKGARHGLKLSGKLARIEAQEQELLEKLKQIREQPSTSKGVPLQNEIVQKWIETKSRKHKTKMAYQEEKQQELHITETDDNNDSINNIIYQNDYHIQSTKKQKQRKKIDEELSAALASISTGEETTSKSKRDKSKINNSQDEWHNIADSSKAIKKKKSKKDRKSSRSPTLIIEAVEINSEVPSIDETSPLTKVNNEDVPRKKKKSRKRIHEDDQVSLDSYRLKADENKEAEKTIDFDSGEFPKKKKSKKSKKNAFEILSEFENEHLQKAGKIHDENSRWYKKQTQINTLALKMNKSMQIKS